MCSLLLRQWKHTVAVWPSGSWLGLLDSLPRLLLDRWHWYGPSKWRGRASFVMWASSLSLQASVCYSWLTADYTCGSAQSWLDSTCSTWSPSWYGIGTLVGEVEGKGQRQQPEGTSTYRGLKKPSPSHTMTKKKTGLLVVAGPLRPFLGECPQTISQHWRGEAVHCLECARTSTQKRTMRHVTTGSQR